MGDENRFRRSQPIVPTLEDGGGRSIGTGEFTDSLALDTLTRFSPLLVDYMRDKPRAVLELKSKSVVIENLQGLEHGGRTIIAWSLNSPEIDLMLSLLDMFKVSRTIFINRADLPGRMNEIQDVAAAHETQIEIGLKLDDELLESYVNGVPVVEAYPNSQAAKTFMALAENLITEYLP